MGDVLTYPTTRKRPFRSPSLRELGAQPENVVRIRKPGTVVPPEPLAGLRRTPELAMVTALTYAVIRNARTPNLSVGYLMQKTLKQMIDREESPDALAALSTLVAGIIFQVSDDEER